MEQLELVFSFDFQDKGPYQDLTELAPIEIFETVAYERISEMARNDKSEIKPSMEAIRVTSQILAKKAFKAAQLRLKI